MTLKTDFFEGVNGINTKMDDVFDSGSAWVTTNMAAISAELQANAAKGLKDFTVSIVTTFETDNLRLENGIHSTTYLSGVTYGLSTEDIYSYECVPELETSDSSIVKVNLVFSF